MAEFTANYNTLFQILVKRHKVSNTSKTRTCENCFPTFAYKPAYYFVTVVLVPISFLLMLMVFA